MCRSFRCKQTNPSWTPGPALQHTPQPQGPLLRTRCAACRHAGRQCAGGNVCSCAAFNSSSPHSSSSRQQAYAMHTRTCNNNILGVHLHACTERYRLAGGEATNKRNFVTSSGGGGSGRLRAYSTNRHQRSGTAPATSKICARE